MEDDVNVLNKAVNTQSVESETTPPAAQDVNQTTDGTGVQTPQEQPQQGQPAQNLSETENLKIALRQAREEIRNLKRGMVGQGYQQLGEGQDIYGHPVFQQLALENATYKLRDGVRIILDQYPQLPKDVAQAIIRNPRGFVNEGTTDVDNALLDIQYWIEDYIESLGQTATTPQPKTVPIMGNNSQVGIYNNADAEIQKILEIPPEDWTPEQEKLVDEYLKKNRS